MDESRGGRCHSCSTHGRFIAHLQVFGLSCSSKSSLQVIFSDPCYEKRNSTGKKELHATLILGHNITALCISVLPALNGVCRAYFFMGQHLHLIKFTASLRGTHNSFTIVWHNILATIRATAEPWAIESSPYHSTLASVLNVEAKTICANFPLQFPERSQRGKRMLVNMTYANC